jgi:hypothetical protein
MTTSCSTSDSQLPSQSKHKEWMKNLPASLHDEPISKIAIPGRNLIRNHRISFRFLFIGTHDSFAYYLTSQPGPDLSPGIRRICLFICPIIKNWSITQNKTFTGI